MGIDKRAASCLFLKNTRRVYEMADSTINVNVGTVSGLQPVGESYFDGGLLQLIGWSLLGYIKF